MTVKALLVSLAIHLMVLLYLQLDRPPPIPPPKPREKVSVVIHEKTAAIVDENPGSLGQASSQKPARKRRSLKKSPSEKVIATNPSSASPITYADLLPVGEVQEVVEGSDPSEGDLRLPYRGTKRGELKTANILLSATFEMPLVFRRSISEGKAYARIRKDGEQLMVAYLGGKPEMRAALWECLRAEGSRETLKNILRYFQSEIFKLTIEYITENVERHEREFEISYEVFEGEVLIHITRFAAYQKFGIDPNAVGTIDDEHAQKARLRDQKHQARFMESPAYKHPLQNEPIIPSKEID